MRAKHIIAATAIALALLTATDHSASAAGKQPPPDQTVKVWPPQWHQDMMYCYYTAGRQGLKRPPAVCARGAWVGQVPPPWRQKR